MDCEILEKSVTTSEIIEFEEPVCPKDRFSPNTRWRRKHERGTDYAFWVPVTDGVPAIARPRHYASVGDESHPLESQYWACKREKLREASSITREIEIPTTSCWVVTSGSGDRTDRRVVETHSEYDLDEGVEIECLPETISCGPYETKEDAAWAASKCHSQSNGPGVFCVRVEESTTPTKVESFERVGYSINDMVLPPSEWT